MVDLELALFMVPCSSSKRLLGDGVRSKCCSSRTCIGASAVIFALLVPTFLLGGRVLELEGENEKKEKTHCTDNRQGNQTSSFAPGRAQRSLPRSIPVLSASPQSSSSQQATISEPAARLAEERRRGALGRDKHISWSIAK